MRDFPVRVSLRLSNFDYSSNNWYFVTICVQDRKAILGDVVGDCPSLSPYGLVVEEQWLMLPDKFSMIDLDEYVIMPNHIHGIIGINHGREYPAPTLGQIIAYYKYQTTKQYNSTQDPICDSVGAGYSRPKHHYTILWQRNYYEHIIRDEDDLDRIRLYIRNNPRNWVNDKLHNP